LTRHFALASLLAMLVVLAPLVYFYRDAAAQALQQHQTEDNVALAQRFASTQWPRHAAFVQGAARLNAQQLRQHAQTALIRSDVLRQTLGLAVVQVRIYDLRGMAAFSTEAQQIGEDRSDDAGVQAALAGRPSSTMAPENHFDGFGKDANGRMLVVSYVPLRGEGQQAPQAVMQVCAEVTDAVRALERSTWHIVAAVLGSLGAFCACLYALVRRAERGLQRQSQSQASSHAAMLAHQALHDPLTGLPNRKNLTRQMQAALHNSKQTCAVLCVGLDGFKEINDSVGHQVGDAALVEVARRLQDQSVEGQLTARMGGDGFLVMLSALEPAQALERTLHAVERVQQAIAGTSVLAAGHDLALTASVGVALYPDDGGDVGALLQAADIALSHAKRSGRNSYQFHTAAMNDLALERLWVERDLRRALDDGQFVLHYQPKIDLLSGHITGAEALIRWQHPTRGLLSPGLFITVAEECGLIVPLGEWVLQEACRQNKAWQQAGMAQLPIAINLAAPHFKQGTLLASVRQTLADQGLGANCLELELTESSLMQDSGSAIATMNQLKAVGLVLALDDFGTGYSSLSQLKGLPLDNLKLDQSFVRGLPHDGGDLAICSAVIAMGRALGLKVIAEGVETNAQLEVLRALGCDVGQGFLFAKPLAPAQFMEFVQRHGGTEVTAFAALELPGL
jgi:diguanylate cyclase (GGDEF)-like protein